jgi:hypothetical protein
VSEENGVEFIFLKTSLFSLCGQGLHFYKSSLHLELEFAPSLRAKHTSRLTDSSVALAGPVLNTVSDSLPTTEYKVPSQGEHLYQ